MTKHEELKAAVVRTDNARDEAIKARDEADKAWYEADNRLRNYEDSTND